MAGKLKSHPQLVQMPAGGLTVANVQFGREKPRVRWGKQPTPNFMGRTKEDVLAEIDRFRSRIADQTPLTPAEYDEEYDDGPR